MTLNVCSKCNSNDVYRKLISARGESFDLLPGAGPWFYGAKIWVYICGSCGHMEFKVLQEHLDKIRKKFDHAP